MRKSFNRKGNNKLNRSIFIFLDGSMKIFINNTPKQKRRVNKFISIVWNKL